MAINKRIIKSNDEGAVVVPTESFNTVLHTPNNSGSDRSLTGVGFPPDFVWMKYRYSTPAVGQHYLFNSVTGDSILKSNATQAEFTGYITSFDPDGVTYLDTLINRTGTDSVVAWCWKAGGAVTPNNNTNGTIPSTVSANPDAGFSIVKFTASSNTNDTLGHGLSSAPEMIIYKRLDGTSNWTVYTNVIDGSWDYLRLNLTDAKTDDSGTWSTASTIKNISTANNWISYCFHSVAGYQKVGSYTGNTSTLPSVDLGFSPRFVMIKEATDTGSWLIYDSVRPSDPATQNNNILFANSDSQESISAGNVLNFTSTGFDIEAGTSELNTNGSTYIYLAIA